jgi:hypothetical protein
MILLRARPVGTRCACGGTVGADPRGARPRAKSCGPTLGGDRPCGCGAAGADVAGICGTARRVVGADGVAFGVVGPVKPGRCDGGRMTGSTGSRGREIGDKRSPRATDGAPKSIGRSSSKGVADGGDRLVKE